MSRPREGRHDLAHRRPHHLVGEAEICRDHRRDISATEPAPNLDDEIHVHSLTKRK